MSANNDMVSHLKRLKHDNPTEFQKEYKEIDKELFTKYCFKINYKDECDPFCTAAFTQTCDYLKKIQELNQKLEIND